MRQKFILQTTFLLCLCGLLMLSVPVFSQPGNTIIYVCTPECANPTPITLTYAGTDATGRHQYEHAPVPTVSAAWNNAESRWEFYHPGVGLGTAFVHSTFGSTPNPPDKVTGNYQTGDYFGFDCIGSGSDADFNITGTGTQNFLGGAMPITLTTFTGKPSVRNIILEWQTSTELNNDYMVIERSADGKQFQEIGRVNGAGTTNIAQQYSFTDRAPFLGTNYYRLRQVDFDGKTTFHDVITVNYQMENVQIRLTPNPTTDQLVVQLAQLAEKSLDIVLYNMYGQSVLNHTLSAGHSQFELDLSQLASGQYILELSDAGQALFLERITKN